MAITPETRQKFAEALQAIAADCPNLAARFTLFLEEWNKNMGLDLNVVEFILRHFKELAYAKEISQTLSAVQRQKQQETQDDWKAQTQVILDNAET